MGNLHITAYRTDNRFAAMDKNGDALELARVRWTAITGLPDEELTDEEAKKFRRPEVSQICDRI